MWPEELLVEAFRQFGLRKSRSLWFYEYRVALSFFSFDARGLLKALTALLGVGLTRGSARTIDNDRLNTSFVKVQEQDMIGSVGIVSSGQ